jgi:hypothetical protein
LVPDWFETSSWHPEKEQELEQFFEQHPIQGTERNQKDAIESIHSCTKLKQQ